MLVKNFTLVLLIIIPFFGFSQQSNIQQLFEQKVLEHDQLDLKLKHSSKSLTKDAEITYHYYDITYNGIKIEALKVMSAEKDGQLVYSHIPNLTAKPINYSFSNIEAKNLSYPALEELLPIEVSGLENIEFANNKWDFTYDDKAYELNYKFSYSERNGILIPSLIYQVKQLKSFLSYEINYDLINREFYDKHPLFLSCLVAAGEESSHTNCIHKTTANIQDIATSAPSYYTTKLPAESPLDGMQNYPEAADFIASPYGWHDVDSDPNTLTETLSGNNVDVIVDRNGDLVGDIQIIEPDQNFNYIPDFSKNPEEYSKSAAVNQFYIVNQIHDIMANNGFAEENGNFQKINYYGEGLGNDEVKVHVQFYADFDSKNNAFFLSNVEGDQPWMFFFEFDGNTNGQNLEILEPSDIAGIYSANLVRKSTSLKDTFLIGQVTLVEDEFAPYDDACNDIQNDINGKIALIPQGECEILEQIDNLISAGAIGVLFSNPGELNFPFELPDTVSIPILSIKNSTRLQIMKNIGTDTIKVKMLYDDQYVPDRDASFDNGIIAHEYAHGISNRLVGGPDAGDCLYNAEQMGEGWSDFYGFILTMQESDYLTNKRHIGKYALSNGADVTIRRKPYSTDFSINNYTYTDVKFTGESPHDLGEIWASMLWDLTVRFVEEYGYTENLILGNGGNRKILNLITEALKLTPCSPGFVDGRNAILEADEILYNGENHCMIWEVFAKRGLGYDADQENSFDILDGNESFTLPPQCRSGIIVDKFMTESIKAGDTISVDLRIINNFQQSQELSFTDIIPAHTNYIPGSASLDIIVNGNEIVPTNKMIVSALDTFVVSYKLSTSTEYGSLRIYSDSLDIESEDYYIFTSVLNEDYHKMEFTTEQSATGDYSFHVNHTKNNQELILEKTDGIDLRGSINPFLKFSHMYELGLNFEGTVVEISNNGGLTWNSVEDQFLKNSYNAKVSDKTFVFDEYFAFTGNREWYDTYIDLSEYKDDIIHIRWKVGTGNNNDYNFTDGWYIDDILVYDRYNYNSEVCITQGTEEQCVFAYENGTIVFSEKSVKNAEKHKLEEKISIYPNPATDVLNIRATSEMQQVQLLHLDGRLIKSINLDNFTMAKLEIENLNRGIYLIGVKIGNKYYYDKIIVQ